MHLDRQAEWVWFRVNGERYVALPSGTSGKTYWARADARGCSCPFYVRAGRTCAHMLAVERAAMLEELAEQPAPRLTADDLMPACRDCGDLADGLDGRCDRCASDREWNARRELAGVAR
jgi:hypothetical protein